MRAKINCFSNILTNEMLSLHPRRKLLAINDTETQHLCEIPLVGKLKGSGRLPTKDDCIQKKTW